MPGTRVKGRRLCAIAEVKQYLGLSLRPRRSDPDYTEPRYLVRLACGALRETDRTSIGMRIHCPRPHPERG